MPIALLLIGILFLTAAVRNKQDVLFDTLKSDFTGPNNFLYWGIALFIIGAAGYYKPLKPVSSAFMTLVIIVLFISNRGFFEKFMEQIGSTTHPQSSGGGQIGNVLDDANRMIGAAKSIFGV